MAAVSLTGSGVGALVGIVVIGGVVYYLYSHKKQLLDAVNPMSTSNLAAKTSDQITQILTGDKTATFGGWIYDITHPNQYNPIQPPVAVRKVGPSPSGPSGDNPNFYSTSAANTTDIPGYTSAAAAAAHQFATIDPSAGMMGGWTPAYNNRLGQWELVPPLTPVTWTIIAGVSLALYMHQQSKTKRRRRSRR